MKRPDMWTCLPGLDDDGPTQRERQEVAARRRNLEHELLPPLPSNVCSVASCGVPLKGRDATMCIACRTERSLAASLTKQGHIVIASREAVFRDAVERLIAKGKARWATADEARSARAPQGSTVAVSTTSLRWKTAPAALGKSRPLKPIKALAALAVVVATAGACDRECRFVEGSPRFQTFDCESVIVDVDGCPPGSHEVTPTECECDAGDFVLDDVDGFVCRE